ncbi:XrtA/PEP-CTERM system histidine kinase PrsK [Aurantiacibacter aquimixticola]|uniref:histidine kinase n=1 Tax=Aurantiacibacter aquimixticola TaxID=1958945 RepID=A0A419RSE3_9SPHN|nr:XrtA/PEP-CTERM system histidine kinase PrsK [Aurantiacibacter aquimixticola]RJY08696.1 PEP-CTERM system histidine kinase PrsK [Aurantiacibacter aquimixticola]
MMGIAWELIVFLTYLAAAIAATSLSLWLATNGRARGPAIKASAAALGFAALWAFFVAGFGRAEPITHTALVTSNLAWLWMLYRLFGHDDRDKRLGPIRPVVASLAFIEMTQLAIIGTRLQSQAQPEAEALIVQIVLTLRLLWCIGALVLVHNLFAGASQQARLALRWPSAALGAIFLYDLNFYTIAYLGSDTPDLLEDFRALALLVVTTLLAVGFLRNKSELRFRPSRSFAFQSFSLLLIGAYLVVMVVLAQGLAYAGSDYGKILQTGFVLLASVVALTVMSSKRLRGWLRVTLSKNLFQHRYDYRSEWLRFTDTIGRAGPQAPPLLERAVQAVADITDSPSGLLLTPREEGGLALAARWQWPNIDVPALAFDEAGARFFEESQFIIDLDDIRRGDHEGIPPAACPPWLFTHEQSWALVPLLHYEKLVGVVLLARPPLTRRLDWEDFDLLRVVGRQLASYLAEQSSQDALGDAQRFDEFNRRIAFVMHDIKNLASQLSLLAGNAEKHADKPEFRADMILTLRNSTDKLQGLLARLGRYGSHTDGAIEPVPLRVMLRDIAARYHTQPGSITLIAEDDLMVRADPEALEQALVHLVQNAIEAVDDGTPVQLRLVPQENGALIEIVDSGEGMSPEFIRTRLFKPFHSSKQGGFGIGAFEARELVRAMGGRLDVESREGLGTRFAIFLPGDQRLDLLQQMQDRKKEVA